MLANVLAGAAIAGVLFAVFQLAQVRKQRRRGFEDMFVQRYWDIMDRLSLPAIEATRPADGRVSPDDRRVVISYIRLCEDELDLRAERWIRADTWELWRSGMTMQLRRWPFEDIWREVSAREEAADGQFARLRAAGPELFTSSYDVPAVGGLRLWRGR